MNDIAWITAVAVLVFGLVSLAEADFKKGLTAYEAGNYAAAQIAKAQKLTREWKPKK